jgi:hypothetical protein
MKKVLLAILLVIAMTIPSFAQIEIKSTVEGESVTIDGMCNYKEVPVSIQVFNSDKVSYINQGNTDKDGKFRVSFSLNQGAEYKGTININEEKEEFSLVIKNKEVDPIGPENKPTVTITIEGYKGTILSDKVIEIKEGDNLYAVTKRAVGGKIHKKPDGFVDSIYGQGTRDKGPYSGWMVHVNNKQIGTAAENYDLKGGERIYWFYTLDYRTDKRNKHKANVGIKDEVQNQIDVAKNILDNKNANEKDIAKAIKDVSSKLNEKAQKVNSEKDAKDFVKDVKNMSQVMKKAVDKIKTEKGAKDLASENINVVKTLIKSAEKLKKDSDKKQLSEAVVENMEITLKAMDKIKGKDVSKVAGDVIESAGSLINKLGKENAKEIKEKAVQTAQKAVEKASTQKIEKDQ